MLRVAFAFLLVLMTTAPAGAAEPELTPEQRARIAEIRRLDASLRRTTGRVRAPAAQVRFNLGDRYVFLGPQDARRVLTEAWDNPPDAVDDVLGLILPAKATLLDADGWAAVVTFEDIGLIKNPHASQADYDRVLAEMQATEPKENAERRAGGFSTVHLVGWAQRPSYDPARRDLIWAREIQFGDETDRTLNYDIRHLGRRGVLSLNIVSTMSQLPTIRREAAALADTVEFEPGARYVDAQAGDKAAGLGLAGLVAAGAGVAVAQKAGLFALLAAFGKKAVLLVAAGVAWLAARLRRVFSRGGERADAAPDDRSDPADPVETSPPD